MGATLRLGTRGSQLALWQANTVKARIKATGGPLCDIVVIKTSGDRQAVGEHDRHVLAAVNGKVDLAAEQRVLDFLDEQALAADL